MKRREFLKLTGFLGTALANPINISEADPYNLWKPIPPERLEKSKTICPLCQSFCSINVLKRKELIFGMLPEKDGNICPRLIAYHNVIYNAKRIKTPLLRTGDKGKGKFKPIDYEKALEILKDRYEKGGFFTDAFANGEVERYFLKGLSKKINLYPTANAKAVLNADLIYFDIDRADLVLNFGADLLTEDFFVHRAKTIVEKASSIISFSPCITNATALGETWFPAREDSLGDIARTLMASIKQNSTNGKGELSIIIERIKKAKRVCVVFSSSLMETATGVNQLEQILQLAKSLDCINKEGGVFFYRHNNGSEPFDIFAEKVTNYLIYNIEPAFVYPVNDLKTFLEKDIFVVYMGYYHNEVSPYADLILPLPFFVEKKDVYVRRDSQGFHIKVSNPAIQGGVESIEMRDKLNIELIFQKIFNYKAPYGIRDIDEIAVKLNNKLFSKDGCINEITKKQPYMQITPKLPSKQTAEIKKITLTFYNDFVLHMNTRGSKWAEELGHHNPLLINPITAKTLGIKHGDRVKIKTSKGDVLTKAFIYDGIVENTIALKRYSKKYNLNAYTKGERQFLAKDKELREIWWKNEDVPLEQLCSYKSLKNIAAYEIESIEVVKG